MPAHAGIPVLMLTGLRGHFDRLNAFAHGASAYLTQPYKPNELILAINRLICWPAVTSPPTAEAAAMQLKTSIRDFLLRKNSQSFVQSCKGPCVLASVLFNSLPVFIGVYLWLN